MIILPSLRELLKVYDSNGNIIGYCLTFKFDSCLVDQDITPNNGIRFNVNDKSCERWLILNIKNEYIALIKRICRLDLIIDNNNLLSIDPNFSNLICQIIHSIDFVNRDVLKFQFNNKNKLIFKAKNNGISVVLNRNKNGKKILNNIDRAIQENNTMNKTRLNNEIKKDDIDYILQDQIDNFTESESEISDNDNLNYISMLQPLENNQKSGMENDSFVIINDYKPQEKIF